MSSGEALIMKGVLGLKGRAQELQNVGSSSFESIEEDQSLKRDSVELQRVVGSVSVCWVLRGT